MSSGINVYAVPTARLNEVIGSRDRGTIGAIIAGQQSFLSGIDDIDGDAEMSCADAVTDLVNGERSEGGPGYLYGYALEAICAHVGDELPNICPISGTSEWIDAVDAFLESNNVPLRLNDLVNG